MSQLSECLEVLNVLWDNCPGDNCGEQRENCTLFEGDSVVNKRLCYFFEQRAQHLQEVWKIELDILIDLPPAMGKKLADQGKGRDLLWELQSRFKVCAGLVPSPPFEREDKDKEFSLLLRIMKYRDFLLKNGGYKEEDLGPLPWNE